MRKLNNKGFTHDIVLVMVVVVVAIVGVAYVVGSHADNITPLTTSSSNSVETVSTTAKTTAILRPNLVNDQNLNTTSSEDLDFIGTNQTVTSIGSGQSFYYTNGLKGNVKDCYLVYIDTPTTGSVSVKANFASNNKVITKTISSYNLFGALNQVCVGPGTVVNPGYNISVISSSQPGVTLNVVEDIISS